MALERGRNVGRFVIIGPLGTGGMGEVYAAYDPELDRKVAVKLLRAKLSDAADGASLLLREAQATAKLQHPNVVVVYDVGAFDERVFIAMELIEGETVTAWIASSRPSWREIVEVFIAAGRGLAAAHAVDLVHRDFKPDNVMITRDGQVRVMDFGLARTVGGTATLESTLAPAPATIDAPASALGEPAPTTSEVGPARPAASFLQAHLTRTGAQVGTPAYMAPEQFLPGAAVDARTDQFNFCVALYEALYGQRPFGTSDIGLLQLRAAAGNVQPPPVNSRVPLWVRKILLRGLRPKRDERWPSMTTVLAALADDPAVRRRKWLIAAASISLVAAAALAARFVGNGNRASVCSGGASRLAGIWTVTGVASARREAIHRVFQASGMPFAEQAFVGASRLLDQFAARWVDTYKDACEATHSRGDQSAEVLDLRMGCLGERLGNLRALTDVLERADAKVVENAVSAAGALPSLDRCSDVPLLRAVIEPPRDPAKRREASSVRESLARFIALRDSGQCKAAEANANQLIAGADATGYDPLRADTLVAAGFLGDSCGDFRVAIERLKSGYNAAYAGRNDQAAAEATIHLPEFLNRHGQYDEARTWVGIGRSALKRLDGGGILEAWFLQSEAAVRSHDHNYEGAITDARRSLEIKERLLGHEHPDLVHSMITLGNVLEASGRHHEALAIDHEGLLVTGRVLGPEHPLSALISANIGEILNGLHRYAEAREGYQRAIDIWRRVGADSTFASYGLTGIGLAWLGERRPEAAVGPLEQALAIRIEKHAAPELIGETRFALARALWSRDDAHQRAIALATAARADYADSKVSVAEIGDWLETTRSK